MTKKSRSIDREEVTVVLKKEHADALRDMAWSDGLRIDDMVEIAVDQYVNEKEQ